MDEEESENYYDTEESSEDLQTMFNEWMEEFVQVEYLENSDENWEKVQAMDQHYVWTDHQTCEDPTVTNGVHRFNNSCCWTTDGWYVMEKPWKGESQETTYISYKTGAYLPCPKCNPKAEDEGIEDCEEPECEGTGWINYWFD